MVKVESGSEQARGYWQDRRPLRAGWLVTTVALGIALVVGSVANYRGARAAFDTLNRGQFEILESAIRQSMFGAGEDPAALAAAVSENSEAGLRYLALLDADGEVIAEAGEAAGPVEVPANFERRARTAGIVMIEVDGRVRAFLPRFIDPRRGGGREGAASQQEGSQGPRFPGFGHTVVEFEPVVAAQLMTRAGRSLALGSLAAILLSVAAGGFWRQSVRHEQERREFEQRRRLSQLGEMSAVLAHEIRNPLASLKGNAQLLVEKLPEGTRDRSKAERVVAEATRLEALTTDLLEFARSGPNESRVMDPIDFGRAAIEEAAPGGVVLLADGAPRAWSFDPERMRHALVNILLNAVQASPAAAPELRVAQEKGQLVFEVRDHGAGLEPGSESRLFEPFFTTRTNGTGLGLAVARRVVEAHGGSIEAHNHPEGGAVFRILLPAGKA